MDCGIEENMSGILQSLKTNPKLLRCEPIIVVIIIVIVIVSSPGTGLMQFSIRFYPERVISYRINYIRDRVVKRRKSN